MPEAPADPRGRDPIRNIGASERIEAFLVSAVCAILSIRAALSLTNYPKLGGDSLHIAHMLWGGLLMLVALLLVLSFVGRGTHWFAAILGGIGFGTFIDEVGKFLTHDNDYFYRPAIAIIYVIFILTYLGARRLFHATRYRREEYLVNALQEIGELARHDLDPDEQERALQYLERSDPDHPLVEPLRTALVQAKLVEPATPPLALRIKRDLHRVYSRIVGLRWFASAVILFFAVQLVVKTVDGVRAFLAPETLPGQLGGLSFTALTDRLRGLPVAGWGELFSTVLFTVFVFLGMVRLVLRSRLAGYHWFRRAMLVSIFLGQVFYFYREQVSAILGLAFHILVLAALEYMIYEETRGHRTTG